MLPRGKHTKLYLHHAIYIIVNLLFRGMHRYRRIIIPNSKIPDNYNPSTITWSLKLTHRFDRWKLQLSNCNQQNHNQNNSQFSRHLYHLRRARFNPRPPIVTLATSVTEITEPAIWQRRLDLMSQIHRNEIIEEKRTRGNEQRGIVRGIGNRYRQEPNIRLSLSPAFVLVTTNFSSCVEVGHYSVA